MSCDIGNATEVFENELCVGEVTERLENEPCSPGELIEELVT